MAKNDQAQTQLIDDPQRDLQKIAGMLGVEPKHAADAVSAILEGNATFDVLCNKLISARTRKRFDGKGNWNMTVPKADWEAFVAGVTPLLTTAGEC